MRQAGFRNVRTYIQSGNVLFEAGKESGEMLSSKIREMITKNFGLTIQAVVITPQELADIALQNPFAERPEVDLSRITCHFP